MSLIHIRERLGSRYHLNQATITRYAVYSEGIDNIFHEDPKRAEQILSGAVHMPVDAVCSYAVSSCAENSAEKSVQPVAEPLPAGPSVKDMPEFDPDEGRQHLRDELHRLISTASRLDSALEVKKE